MPETIAIALLALLATPVVAWFVWPETLEPCEEEHR